MSPPLSSSTTTFRHRGQDGFALVVVIMVLLVASFVASDLVMEVRTELQVAFNQKQKAAERYLAEAGINLGLFRIFDLPLDPGEGEDVVFRQGQVHQAEVGGGRVSYYAVSEMGKIDLNTAPPGLLALFCQHLGLSAAATATLADSLADWQDEDDLHRLSGAEDSYYENLQPPYRPRNRPLADPAEFFLVRGSEALAGRFEPEEVFTVYNQKGTLNFNCLPPLLLDFVAGGDPDRVAAYHEARQEKPLLDQQEAAVILGHQRFLEIAPYLSFDSPGGLYYSVVAETGKQQDLQAVATGNRIFALIKLEGMGFRYLLWKERTI